MELPELERGFPGFPSRFPGKNIKVTSGIFVGKPHPQGEAR